MQLTDRFEPSGKDIVSEEIDGEVVIVNLKNGNYYSLTQSATNIWSGIQSQAKLGDIREGLTQRYSGDVDIMHREFDDLIKALTDEELIRPLADINGVEAAGATTPAGDGEKEAYLSPMFERFTDMGDLLLLDPVHEAEEEKGWPHAKNDS